MRLKVSNVCQLVPISDKADEVVNGVTFTNNHNGTWTLSGTSTADYSYYNLFINIPLRQGHIYLNASSFGNAPQTYVEIKWINKDGVIQWGANPYTADENSKCDIGLLKLKGNLDTVVLCPQLFDLTEMYGAGNEPTTVAQFRQDFPNEMYEYSPVCWKKFRRLKYVTETKNLFDVNNAVPYTFTNDNPPSSRISLKDGIYTTTYNNYNVGSGLRIKDGLVLSPGTYTLSLSVITVGETTPITGLTYGFRLYKSDGTKPVITTYTEAFSSRISHAFTIPSDCTDIRLYLAPHCDSGQEYVYISIKDIQLEKGSTATPYQPYGYLPLNRGKYIANKEPVQLLDKSEFETVVSKGVTATPDITNGMWTISGAATASEYLQIGVYYPGTDFNIGDKLFLKHSNIDNSVYFPYAAWYDKDNKYLGEKDGMGVFSVTNPKTAYIACYFTTRTVGDINVTTQVQLFNLTRMYGKGNEPTAAEFVAQYPGFDYSVNKYNAITFR